MDKIADRRIPSYRWTCFRRFFLTSHACSPRKIYFCILASLALSSLWLISAVQTSLSSASLNDIHDSSPDCFRFSALAAASYPSPPRALRFPRRSDVETFRDAPAKFPPALLEYTHGELLSRNATNGTVRTRIDLADSSTLDLLFGDSSIPVAFLLNLDQRPDRLEVMLSEWDGRVRFIRLSAKPHTGGSNGVTLSHIALILTLERLGWPYALAFEDDAARADGWDELGQEILRLARISQGDFTVVNFGPSRIVGRHGVQAIVPHVLWAAPAGTLATTVVLWGRRSIAPAHAFLGELADATAVHMASIDVSFSDTYRGFELVPWVPAKLGAFQRPGFSDNVEPGRRQKTDFTGDFDTLSSDLLHLRRELVAAEERGVSSAETCYQRFWLPRPEV